MHQPQRQSVNSRHRTAASGPTLSSPPHPHLADAIRDTLQTALGTGYTLGRELGGGGMSRVWTAHDTTLGRDVVVKLLSQELVQEMSVERFTREVRLAANLQHA
jgi:eukaryotic-like serine/threonine-protein kinase